MAGDLFERFAPQIQALPDGALTQQELMSDAFRLDREGDLEVYYVPFERVNASARVVLVGITPGWTQMRIAYEVARDGLQSGDSRDAILEAVDQTASFAGAMRANLDRMLDDLGLPAMLGIENSAQLFGSRSELMHSTSASRNPVFVSGRNYTGAAPSIPESGFLRRTVTSTLGPELASVADAIVIPLGKAAEQAVELLVDTDQLAPERCCLGFPHPSGANGHRLRLFRQRRTELADSLAAWFDPAAPPPPRTPQVDVWQRIGQGLAAGLSSAERAEFAERLRSLADELDPDH